MLALERDQALRGVTKVRPVEPAAKGATRSDGPGDRDDGVSDEGGFPRISVMALVSIGLPFLSLLLFLSRSVSQREWTRVAFFLPPAAVVLGIAALFGIHRSGGTLRGRGFAIAGIVIGLAGTLVLGLVMLMFWSIMRCFEGC